MTRPMISVRAMRDPFALSLVDNFDHRDVTFVRGWHVYAGERFIPRMCVMEADDGRMYGIYQGRTYVVARAKTPTNVAYGTWRRTEGASCS